MSLQRKLLKLSLAASAFFYALPLCASEVAESGGSEEGGLPQLDTSLFPEQLFWLAVSFAVLYFLMSRFALPGVKKTQDKRQEVLSTELSAASYANDQARTMVMQYERALSEARAKAQATISDMTARAAAESAARQAAQQQDLGKRLQDAEAKIRTVRDEALSEVKGAAVELAHGIVEKISGMKVKA